VGYIVRRQFFSGEPTPQGQPYAIEVTEEPGCEDAHLHTPGGVRIRRDGLTVFATAEEALEDAARRGEAEEKGGTG
jgi:hypothetical protein